MTVRLSLLALLDQAPCYGYQLRAELDWRTGGSGPVNVGQVYNTLDRLERDKLVRKTGEHNYYEITAAGSLAVAAWFGSSSAATELPAKLALAATLPGVDVAAIILAQRSVGLAEATTTAPTIDTPTTAEQLAAAILATATGEARRSEERLLGAVEELLALGIHPVPLSTDVPKRGRPAKLAS
jgi:DNA-binding PadR family transcriptional regulator